jgi:hypothetical protein
VTVATAGKGIAWAARQGANDRQAGTECRKYKKFLITYELPRSDTSLRLWNTYLKQTKVAHPNASSSKPEQKSRRTRGLTPSGASSPPRKIVRRYDYVNPRGTDLSPENAALLMRVNQQNTLVDMWR